MEDEVGPREQQLTDLREKIETGVKSKSAQVILVELVDIIQWMQGEIASLKGKIAREAP